MQPKVNAYAPLSGTANSAVLAGVDPPLHLLLLQLMLLLQEEAHGSYRRQSKGRAVKIIAELRAELARRGARGIVGLAAVSREDDNGDGQLSKSEFKKAMDENQRT